MTPQIFEIFKADRDLNCLLHIGGINIDLLKKYEEFFNPETLIIIVVPESKDMLESKSNRIHYIVGSMLDKKTLDNIQQILKQRRKLLSCIRDCSSPKDIEDKFGLFFYTHKLLESHGVYLMENIYDKYVAFYIKQALLHYNISMTDLNEQLQSKNNITLTIQKD